MTPFEVLPGVVSDETLFDSPARWSDADKARFRNGKVEPIGGWAAYNATSLSDVCRNVLVWTDNYNSTNVAFGSVASLKVEYGGTIYDITPTGLTAGYEDTGAIGPGGFGMGGFGLGGFGVGEFDTQARVWSLATYGQNLMAAPRLGTLYRWANDTAVVAAEVSNAPDTIIAMNVASDRRQVIAFGCTDTDGAFDPTCIRGSALSDYTTWAVTSTGTAFESKLGGGSPIVGQRNFGDRDAIWTEEAVWLGTYVGSATQAYRTDLQATNCGLAGMNAACVYNRTAYWLTPDLRFYVWPFGGIPQELPCPIRRDFADNIDRLQIIKVVACPIGKMGEIWWQYPDSRDGDENSRYVSFHVDESARAGFPVWSRGTLARTAATDSGTLLYPLMVTSAGVTYLHENGTSAAGSALTWYATSGGQYVGEGQRRSLVRGMWPDIEAQVGSVSLTLFSYDYPQDSSSVTYGPYTLAVNDNRSDFMAEGRMFAVKFGGSAAGTFARIGKPMFDAVPTGGY